MTSVNSDFPLQFSSGDPDRHFAFDPDFLVRLELGVISDDERKAFLKHIDTCPDCLDTVAELIHLGILFDNLNENENENEKLSDRQIVSGAETPSPVTSVSCNGKKSFMSMNRLLLAAAAVVLVAVVLVPFWPGDHNSVARKDLNKILTPADRKFPVLLTQYGYNPKGYNAIKSINIPNKHETEVRLAYEELLIQQDNDENRMEYVRWLLYVGNDERTARTIFNELKNKMSQNALLLNGLIYFKERNDVQAQAAFEKYLEKDPDQWQIRYNLAVSLYRSGNTDRAKSIFRDIRSQIDQQELTNTIDRLLQSEPNSEKILLNQLLNSQEEKEE